MTHKSRKWIFAKNLENTLDVFSSGAFKRYVTLAIDLQSPELCENKFPWLQTTKHSSLSRGPRKLSKLLRNHLCWHHDCYSSWILVTREVMEVEPMLFTQEYSSHSQEVVRAGGMNRLMWIFFISSWAQVHLASFLNLPLLLVPLPCGMHGLFDLLSSSWFFSSQFISTKVKPSDLVISLLWQDEG